MDENGRPTEKIVTVRLPLELLARIDFVTRNIDSMILVNRSAAIRDALQKWLPVQEQRLIELGIITPKKAPQK